MSRFTFLVVPLLLGLALLTPARANTIGPNCGSCNGSIYTLNYYQSANQINTTNYTLQLLVDASGFQNGNTTAYLAAIAPNVPGWSNAMLIAAPGGTGDWSATQSGGLNSSGCDGSGAPFFCNSALSTGSFNQADPAASASWEFLWTLTDATPLNQLQGGLKALYTDAQGNKIGPVLSEDMTFTPVPPPVTPVPEPATWTLMLLGLAGVAWIEHRRHAPVNA